MIEHIIGGKSIQRNNHNVSDRGVSPDMITPPKEYYEEPFAVDHTSEPIKDLNDILKVSRFLIENERWRDNMLFIVGINFGLRVSDLRQLRFSDIIDENLKFKDTFPVFEIKTRNTRKRKRNRYITINNAVCDAVSLYLEHTDDVSLSDFMFRSMSNRGRNNNRPLSLMSVDRILKGIAKDCNLGIKMSTHSLRKTFAYHQMLESNNDPRKLLLLQKMLGHATMSQTLDYIGLTQEEIHDAYLSTNLGDLDSVFDSDLEEEAG